MAQVIRVGKDGYSAFAVLAQMLASAEARLIMQHPCPGTGTTACGRVLMSRRAIVLRGEGHGEPHRHRARHAGAPRRLVRRRCGRVDRSPATAGHVFARM